MVSTSIEAKVRMPLRVAGRTSTPPRPGYVQARVGESEGMEATIFPAEDLNGIALNVVSVIILYGPAYLANTGAMLFGKWMPDLFGFQNHKIDAGKTWSDGNRVLGDGKSWEGLFGGALFSAGLMVLAHILWEGHNSASERPFLDPSSLIPVDAWYHFDEGWASAFLIGFILGLACMVGDSAGSFIKRRRGLKREGEISSRAPLLDTLPFALGILGTTALLFHETIFFQSSIRPYVVALLILTPVMHRVTNIIGYRLGLKSVPY
tara:strand:+ start:7809 stop:8600 length:792 start_codon:yes stop_codon:yes gene_type:complete